MSKLKLEGKEIASTAKVGKAEIIHFTDDTFIIVDMLSDNMTAEEAGFELGEEVIDDPEEITIDEMKEDLLKGKHVTKKKLKGMDDEEIEELWDEHFDDNGDGKGNGDGDGDPDELTAEDLNEADYDDLEDIIEDEDLDLDIDDYEDDAKGTKKLRKAVAKELKIKL